MSKRTTKKLYAFCIICCFLMGFFMQGSASAITETWDGNSILQKATLTGLRRCYTTGKIKDTVDNIGLFTTFDDVIESSDGDYIALPSGLTGIKSDNTIRCGTLFMGGGSDGDSFKGLFELSGKPAKYKDLGGDEVAKKTLLEGMGYTRVQTSNTNNNCIYFTYSAKRRVTQAMGGGGTHEEEKTAMTKNVCVDNDNKIYVESLPTTICDDKGSGYGGFSTDEDVDDNEACDLLSLQSGSSEQGVIIGPWKLLDSFSGGMSGQYEYKSDAIKYEDYGNDWGRFKRGLISKMSTDFSCNLKRSCANDWVNSTMENSGFVYRFLREEGGTTENNPEDKYKIKGGGHHGGKMGVAADKAVSFLSSYQGYDGLKFTKAEKLSYYLLALQHWIFDGKDLNTYYKCDVADYTVYGYKKININPQTRESVGNCAVDPQQKVPGRDFIFGFTSEDYFDASGGTKIYFDDLIEEINKLSEEVSQEELAEVPVSEGESSDVEVEATCGNSGGAESLGWIVCPILQWMSKAATDVYNSALKPALNVEPKLFAKDESGNGTDAVHDAWRAFRDIANILFTILFLVVIFSQLTGVGIDNYGIKKILPKLIIAAVLINLSYLICLICVDLSNIVGNGLQDFFEGLPTGDIANSKIKTYIETNSAAGPTLISGLILALLGAGTVFAIWKEPGSLIALLVGALGVVIAIFFVFILLAAREAAIIVLTVLSPLAVVCYMLPNTKKLFDRWMKLWEGLLLIFPICGALIGGGNFVSQLLLSTGMATEGFWSAFIAMIVGALPIFFIPTVLKNAFAAMGAIGAKITGFGDRMRSGATRGMRNSNLYQDAQKRSQARNQRISARRRAGIKLDKDGNVVESRRPTARLRRKMAGTWAGRRLGMEAAMGQSAAEFASMEATRRGNIANMDMESMQATFAGINDKEAAQRVANRGTLMAAGKVKLEDGTTLNVNNQEHLQRHHREMLIAANQAKANGDIAKYNAAMDSVKAAQNLMAKTDAGRTAMKANYEQAIDRNETGGLNEAAGHLLSAHGADVKAVNRAMFRLTQDIATADFNMKPRDDGSTDLGNIKDNMTNDVYKRAGLDKYTAQSFANADDQVFKDLMGSVNTMSSEERAVLGRLIDEARQNANIQVQDAVEARFKQIDEVLGRGGSSDHRAPGDRVSPGGVIY